MLKVVSNLICIVVGNKDGRIIQPHVSIKKNQDLVIFASKFVAKWETKVTCSGDRAVLVILFQIQVETERLESNIKLKSLNNTYLIIIKQYIFKYHQNIQ